MEQADLIPPGEPSKRITLLIRNLTDLGAFAKVKAPTKAVPLDDAKH
jgi:hypothetical protein